MADDKGYTTEEKIEAYLGISIVENAANSAILAAEAFIDQFTSRNFKADDTASARLYNGDGRQSLIIDDCVEIEKVEVGNDQWGDTFVELVNTGSTPEYYELPNNHEEEGLPIRKIGSRTRSFIPGNANQRITAKWGWSVAVPDDISFAATVLASGMYYKNLGLTTGGIKSEKIGEYQAAYADKDGFNDMKISLQTLESYKKHLL